MTSWVQTERYAAQHWMRDMLQLSKQLKLTPTSNLLLPPMESKLLAHCSSRSSLDLRALVLGGVKLKQYALLSIFEAQALGKPCLSGPLSSANPEAASLFSLPRTSSAQMPIVSMKNLGLSQAMRVTSSRSDR